MSRNHDLQRHICNMHVLFLPLLTFYHPSPVKKKCVVWGSMSFALNVSLGNIKTFLTMLTQMCAQLSVKCNLLFWLENEGEKRSFEKIELRNDCDFVTGTAV